MQERVLVAFIATYDEVKDAHQDFEEVKQAHAQGHISEYDAAVVWRNEKGKVQIDSVSHEASRKWLLAGVGAGALIGLIFPPSILATTAIGALSGAIIGRFRDGISDEKLEQIGDALTGDNAALVVVAEENVAEALQKIGAKLDASNKQVEATLSYDPSLAAAQMQAAIVEASAQLQELTRLDDERASKS